MTNLPESNQTVVVHGPISDAVRGALNSGGYVLVQASPDIAIYSAVSASHRPSRAHPFSPDATGSDAETDSNGARRTAPTDKLLLTPEEAAEVLSVGRTKIYQLLAAGALPSVRIGTSRRIPASGVRDLVAHLASGTLAEAPGPTRPTSSPAAAVRRARSTEGAA